MMEIEHLRYQSICLSRLILFVWSCDQFFVVMQLIGLFGCYVISANLKMCFCDNWHVY